MDPRHLYRWRGSINCFGLYRYLLVFFIYLLTTAAASSCVKYFLDLKYCQQILLLFPYSLLLVKPVYCSPSAIGGFPRFEPARKKTINFSFNLFYFRKYIFGGLPVRGQGDRFLVPVNGTFCLCPRPYQLFSPS